MAHKGSVSPLTLNRLSIYLRCLRSIRDGGATTISSQELADRFELSAPQIRKDLAHFGEFGIRGIGYDVERLGQKLRGLLRLEHHHPTLVVGVGGLGTALIRFLSMGDGAFRVVAAVDNDPKKIGRKVAGLTVAAPEELAGIVERTATEIGILTVPADAAQVNYDNLVNAGVRGVLNFAPIRLERRAGILTRSVDLRIFFEELAFSLHHSG